MTEIFLSLVKTWKFLVNLKKLQAQETRNIGKFLKSNDRRC